jgi:hypothetical protein
MKILGYVVAVLLFLALLVGLFFGDNINNSISAQRFKNQCKQDSIAAAADNMPGQPNQTFKTYTYIQSTPYLLFTSHYVDSLQAIIDHLWLVVRDLKKANKALEAPAYHRYWCDGDTVMEITDILLIMKPINIDIIK